jgi:DNA-binding transcriptional LysR family regulator
VLKEMVRLGMGWTVLSPVDAEIEPHALTKALDEPIATRTLTLARRADRVPNAALGALLDALVLPR